MPGREIQLVNNEIYHVFNRGIASQPIFLSKRDYGRAFETSLYYQNSNPPVRYSRFVILSVNERKRILEELESRQKFLIEIIAYCFMPNHFHLLLRQIEDNGISKYMANFINSYTKYFNTKNQRDGPLLAGKFKAVRIETEEQLIHVSRYIHLNPHTAYFIKDIQRLVEYPYSSFPEYIGKSQTNVCNKEIILSLFRTQQDYQDFVFNQADYQRKLDQIKHLLLE